MSRKDSSFGQLVEYLEKGMNDGDERFAHFHNMHPGDREHIVKDFLENAEYLRRKEGVQMFHEILSFTRSNELSNDQQKAILMESVKEYLSERAPECMAYSVIHDEKEHHLHAHIVISSNPLESEKRHRLSKHDFEKVKRHAEKNVLENYPEMQQELTIDKKGAKRESKGETELKKRGGRTTQKDKTHDTLKAIFSQARSEKELEDALKISGLAMSYRAGNRKSSPRFGKAGSKKHFRLSTLGLDVEYQQLVDNIATEKDVQEPLPKDIEGKSKTDAIKKVYGEKIRDGVLSKKEAEKQARESIKKTQTKANQYPWQADVERRQEQAEREARGEDVRSKAEKVGKEWVVGDFEARDAQIRKEKYAKQNKTDKKVKDRKEQTFSEKASEEAKEWFTGNFEARGARARKAKFDKLKKDSKTVKDITDQSKAEKAKEKLNEYVKGDFSARDARAFKETGEKKYNEPKRQAEKDAQEAWMKEDETREFIDAKVQANEAEKGKRAEARKARFSSSRSASTNTGKDGKESDGKGGK